MVTFRQTSNPFHCGKSIAECNHSIFGVLTGRLGLASVSPSIVNKKAIITDDGCQDKCMTNSMYRGMETLKIIYNYTKDSSGFVCEQVNHMYEYMHVFNAVKCREFWQMVRFHSELFDLTKLFHFYIHPIFCPAFWKYCRNRNNRKWRYQHHFHFYEMPVEGRKEGINEERSVVALFCPLQDVYILLFVTRLHANWHLMLIVRGLSKYLA